MSHPRTASPDSEPGRDVFGDGSALAVPLEGHAPGQHGPLFPQLNKFLTADACGLSLMLEEGRNALLPRRGIVGRGVLLDIAALRGAPLEPGSAIYPADLEAAEQAQGLRVGKGDILFVRNGGGVRNVYKLGTGLHPSCLPWLQQRRVAVLSGDSDNDVHPPLPGFHKWTEPIHMVALPYLGLPLLDQVELETLSQV